MPADKRDYKQTVKMLQMALSVEDLESHRALKDLEMREVKIRTYFSNDEKFKRINKKGKKGKTAIHFFHLPSKHGLTLKEYDEEEVSLVIEVIKESKKGPETVLVSGKIQSIKFIKQGKTSYNTVYFTSPFFFKRDKEKSFFLCKSINFELNRLAMRASMKVISELDSSLLEYLSFDENVENDQLRVDDHKFVDDDLKWSNEQVSNNKEQTTAIKNIVNCTAFPYPYVIFGPPGENWMKLFL